MGDSRYTITKGTVGGLDIEVLHDAAVNHEFGLFYSFLDVPRLLTERDTTIATLTQQLQDARVALEAERDELQKQLEDVKVSPTTAHFQQQQIRLRRAKKERDTAQQERDDWILLNRALAEELVSLRHDFGADMGASIERNAIQRQRAETAERDLATSQQEQHALLETLQEYQAVVFGAVQDGVYVNGNYWWNRMSDLWWRDCKARAALAQGVK